MTIRNLRFPLLTIAVLLAAMALAACGGETEPTAHGADEGSYIKAGPLVYQVEVSRELNPANPEDIEYLQGLPGGTTLPSGQEWFGVWLRVQNATDRAHPVASDFRIVDTTGAVYRPIALPKRNILSYQQTAVPSDAGQDPPVTPNPETAAGSGPINGTLLLFKLDTSVYSNRPLDLEITPPAGGPASSVVLDL
ncbi:MAG TPA: hypothetical protein VFV85_08755 [Conexibacter sp.]|nr:hypothetical protein [Conexibacter sp.]